MTDKHESNRANRPQLWEAPVPGSGATGAGQASLPPEVMPTLKELARPARQSDMPWRIELCQHGLLAVERKKNP